jgi:predicted transcriptional regulator
VPTPSSGHVRSNSAAETDNAPSTHGRPAWATNSLYARAYDPDAQQSISDEKSIGPPASGARVTVRLELTPEVDRTLCRLASAVGLPPTVLLGRVLTDGVQSEELKAGVPTEGTAEAAPKRRTTRILRQVRLQRATRRRLHEWTVATGQRPSRLATWKILQSQALDASSVDTPLGAYQRLIDILHPSGSRGGA